jgi:hypothetical protein
MSCSDHQVSQSAEVVGSPGGGKQSANLIDPSQLHFTLASQPSSSTRTIVPLAFASADSPHTRLPRGPLIHRASALRSGLWLPNASGTSAHPPPPTWARPVTPTITVISHRTVMYDQYSTAVTPQFGVEFIGSLMPGFDNRATRRVCMNVPGWQEGPAAAPEGSLFRYFLRNITVFVNQQA